MPRVDPNPVDENEVSRIQRAVIALHGAIERDQWRSRGSLCDRISQALGRKKTSGLYPSYTQLSHFFLADLIHKPFFRRFKRSFKLNDNNMFVTAIITQCLLEADQLGVISVNPEQVLRSVAAVLEHRDKTLPEGVSGYCFYRQKLQDRGWVQHPDNITTTVAYLRPILYWIYRIAMWLHIDGADLLWLRSPGVVDLITKGDMSELLERFNMPSDADDTGWALCLGATLKESTGRFSDAAQLWERANLDTSGIMDHIKRYAYRPNGEDQAVNIIDPRTYYWMRSYLHQNPGPDVAVMTTWMQNPYEGRQFGNRHTKIPMNMNNVDPTVCSNLILGINKALTAYPDKASRGFDREFQACYLDTVRLLCWTLDNEWVTQEPDVTVLYYPTTMHFFWSLARNLHHLEGASIASALPFTAMQQAKRWLAGSLRKHGTRQLLAQAMCGDNEGTTYWHGTLETGEDRVYGTALAINALLDIWTRESSVPGEKLRWIEGTPSDVKDTVSTGVRWLYNAITVAKLPMYNACFSGSVKGFGTLPFVFPLNVRETYGDLIIFGIRGVIPEGEFERSLAEKRASIRSGTLGKRSEFFSHWSSPAITRAVSLLALAKSLCVLPRSRAQGGCVAQDSQQAKD
ncbi:MAG TPA: hypothetical protein VMY98_09680 [Anaerolineae bacterium]|nr:hypothetical protein [Anaerolineae bacterium]